MKLVVAQISPEGQNIELSPKLDWVRKMVHEALFDEKPVEKSIRGSIEIGRIDDQLHLEGNIYIDLHPVCDRCLDPFLYQLHVPIKMNLAPLHDSKEEKSRKRFFRGEQNQQEDEIELSKADLEFSFYKGSEIDLQEILKEHMVLALPLRFLCREDCKGLCPNCGTNLNQKTCTCSSRNAADSRWEIFKHLRPK